MIYESKRGHLEKKDQRTVNYYGSLTVSGTGEIKLPCRGRPIEVTVGFSDPTPPKPGCGPQVDDLVEISVVQLLPPFPFWAIKLSWDIQGGNIREIAWQATVTHR